MRIFARVCLGKNKVNSPKQLFISGGCWGGAAGVSYVSLGYPAINKPGMIAHTHRVSQFTVHAGRAQQGDEEVSDLGSFGCSRMITKEAAVWLCREKSSSGCFRLWAHIM